MANDGMHIRDQSGAWLLDAASGRLRCPLGLHRPKIAAAVARQLRTLDRPPPLGFADPLAVEFRRLLLAAAPDGFDHVLVTASGEQAFEIARLVAHAATGAEPVLADPLDPVPATGGALFALDERATAPGRSGRPFAAQALGLQPDLIVLGEALGNGAVPIGALLLPDRLIEHAPALPPAFPAALAAAIETQMILRRENLVLRAERLVQVFCAALALLPNLVAVRQLGLLARLQLEPGRGHGLARRLQQAGLIAEVTGNELTLAPALIAEGHHIHRMAAILTAVLASPASHQGAPP